MEMIGEDALSFTKVTFMNTILFPTVVSLVGNRHVKHANSGAVVIFALMIAKMLITTVMTIIFRVA
jgi:hypothetical protein